MPPSDTFGDEAVALLRDLVRVDTTNPPGQEAAAAEVLAEALRKDGYDPVIREAAPGRANLVARRQGDGSGGGPLLLTGHLDVVPADPAGWSHPPFAAEIADGWLFGRGALDMKNHLAASAMVMRRLAREGVTLRRDVIFAAVADEEAGCRLGSQFLVDEHPDLVRAEWALGEMGGITVWLEQTPIYPIQTAHRGVAWLSMKAPGRPGHGSIPSTDSAVHRLARAVMRLSNLPLPVHVSEPARRTLLGLAEARGGLSAVALRLLARPALTDFVLHSLIGDPKLRNLLSALLRNTASVTGLSAGEAPNVFPAVAEATIDGRLVPGQTAADLLRELEAVVEDDRIRFEVLHELAPFEAPPASPLLDLLGAALRAMDPAGHPIPQLVPAFTDASAFARLGVKTYGFTPVVFPFGSPSFAELVHGVDERIPVDGFKQGLQALWEVVLRFCA